MDLRILLQNKLVERCKRNPKYSLRAFANSLNISHSALSEILRDRRQIGPKTKNRLVKALQLRPDEMRIIDSKPSDLEVYNHLAADTFAVIADWYHFAILE